MLVELGFKQIEIGFPSASDTEFNFVKELVNKGHKVILQKNAGLESNFSDKEYLKSGATIYETADDIYNNSEMILKVKEPIKEEYNKIKKMFSKFCRFCCRYNAL